MPKSQKHTKNPKESSNNRKPRSSKEMSLNKAKNAASLSQVKKTINEELPLDKAKRIIPAEQKYVRRTKEEFEAGAIPMKTGSHRLVDLKVRVTPELKHALQEAIARSGVTDSQWYRAALRKALRLQDELDVDFELGNEIELPAPKAEPKG